MSRGKAVAQPERVDQHALLRQLQKALAVATCIEIAAEYNKGERLDLADAIAGLLILLEGAAVMLDPPGGAP